LALRSIPPATSGSPPASNGTLYFGSDRPGGLGKTDLTGRSSSSGRYAPPENLGPSINSDATSTSLHRTDESFLIFMASGAPTTPANGMGDLYITTKKDGAWTPPKNLGPTINRRALDIGAFLSFDGKSLYWSSARKAGPQRPRRHLPDRSRRREGAGAEGLDHHVVPTTFTKNPWWS
jgi:hypothetical protein